MWKRAHFVGTRFTGFESQLKAVVQTARQASSALTDVLRGLDGDDTHRPIITEFRRLRLQGYARGSAARQLQSLLITESC